MAGLSERLYGAVCTNPGALMTVLAAHVGATPRELNRPALILRRAGRVRSVGQRQSTRYFPMGEEEAGLLEEMLDDSEDLFVRYVTH